jgi:hypothetical protein
MERLGSALSQARNELRAGPAVHSLSGVTRVPRIRNHEATAPFDTPAVGYTTQDGMQIYYNDGDR